MDGKLGGVQVSMPELEKAVGRHGTRDEVAARWWAHLMGRLPTSEELSTLSEATSNYAGKGDDNTKGEKKLVANRHRNFPGELPRN